MLNTIPVGITQQASVGPCCETHLDPCSQELYQLGHSRELVTENVALDLQNRKMEESVQQNCLTSFGSPLWKSGVKSLDNS